MNVKSRLKEFLKLQDIKVIDFERSISASNGYVNSISKSIGVDKISLIIENYPNLNIEWLLTGNGNILRSSNNNSTNIDVLNEPSEIYHNSNGNKFIELKNGKFKIIVKKVPVKAFGSYLSDFQNVEFLEDLEDVSFTVDHLGKGKYMCFEVEGDSMNGGNLYDSPDGAELLCRELGKQHWKDGFRDSTYGWVIVHKQTVLFKDIIDFDVSTGDITCHSRSGLPNHSDFKINLDDVHQILKVIKRTF
jgi:hypothetical protein